MTSSNNPKELKIKEEISQHLLDLPKEIQDLINDAISKNHFEYPDEAPTKNALDF